MADKFFLDFKSADFLTRMQPLFDSIDSESAMPAVLICAAFIEHCLADVLREFLIEGHTADALLKPDRGLLGSLSTRNQMAYCLGLIEKRVFQNIMTIGEIRNQFAHSPTPLDFDVPAIVELCNKLIQRNAEQFVGDEAAAADPPDTVRSP